MNLKQETGLSPDPDKKDFFLFKSGMPWLANVKKNDRTGKDINTLINLKNSHYNKKCTCNISTVYSYILKLQNKNISKKFSK